MKSSHQKIIRVISILSLLLIAQISGYSQTCDPITRHSGDPLNAVCTDIELRGEDTHGSEVGTWTTTGGATIDDPNNRDTWVRDLDLGNNTFIWSITDGGVPVCSSSIVVVGIRVQAEAGLNQPDACASTTLAADNPAPGTGAWTGPGGVTFGNPASATSTVSNLNIGDNTLTWTVTNSGCVTTDNVVITNNTPFPVDAGTDDEACINNSIALNGTQPPAGQYGQWTVITGAGVFANPTLFSTTVSGLDPDVNEFQWRITFKTCSASDQVEITNNTVVATASNQSICGTTATLDGNDPAPLGASGLWTVVTSIGNITAPAQHDTQVTNLNPDANTFNWELSKGTCTDDIDIVITNTVPVVSAGIDQHVCGATATVTGSSPGSGTGLWTRRTGSGTITLPNSSITTITGLGNGVLGNIFRWTVTQGTCSSYDEVIIYNDTPATANAGADDVSCDGTFDPLGGNNPPVGYGTGQWSAAAGIVFTNNSVFNTGVSGLSLGDNILTWTITRGACTSSDDVTIVYDEITPADAGIDQPVSCINTATMAAVAPTEGTGQWSLVTGTGTFTNNTDANTTVTNVGRGNNVYRWTVTKNTCSDYDDVLIRNYSVVANAGVDEDICTDTRIMQGNPAAAQFIGAPANIGATGQWSVVPTSVVINNTDAWNTTVSNLSQDANNFTWTMTNGYCTDDDQVTINNYRPITPDAGVDTTFCGIDFAGSGYSSVYSSLNANNPTRAGEVGVWTIQAGHATFLDPTNSNVMRVDDLDHYAQTTGPDYWNQHPVINTFRWTISYHNCELYDEVDIVNAAPFAANAGPDQDVCFDEANLNAVDHGWGAQIHQWTEIAPGGSGAVIANPDEFNSYVSGLQSGQTTFRWTKENTLDIFGKGNTTCTLWDDVIIDRVLNTGRPNAGPDQAVCATEAIMSASPANTGFSITAPETVEGEWSTLVGNGNFADINSPSTLVTNLAYRTNIFRWTVTYDNGVVGAGNIHCITTDDVDILNALPSNANTGPDQNVCANTALLSADRPTRGSGAWSVIGGGGTITNESCQGFLCTAYVYNMGTGQNTFLWTMTYNYTDPASGLPDKCELTDQIEVWNWEITANAGADQYVCVDNATIEANQPYGSTGVWDRTGGSGNITNPNNSLTTVTSLSPNLNSFRWTLNNGHCTAEDYINITNNNPDNPVAGGDQILCTNTTNLAANNPINGTGEWSVALNGGVIVSSLNPTTSVTNIPQGLNQYRWTITKGTAPYDCSEEDIVDIYNNSVTAKAGNDIDNICGFEVANSSVSLNAEGPNYTNGETGNWTVFTSTGTIQTPTLNTSQVTGMDRGENIFRWTLTNTRGATTCTNSDFVSVFVYIPTTANADIDREFCLDENGLLALNANSPVHGQGLWSWAGTGALVPTFTTPSLNNTTVTNLGLNETVLRWTITDNGCSSSDEMTVTRNYVLADAGNDEDICVTDYQLDGNDPLAFGQSSYGYASGQWALVNATGTFTKPTLYNTTITGLRTSPTPENTLRWTITKGSCSSSDDVIITNNAIIADAGADEYVCANFIASLDGNDVETLGGSGIWTWSNAAVVTHPTSYRSRVENLQGGLNSFTWTVTSGSGGCTDDDIVEIHNESVTANAGFNVETCNPFADILATNPDKGTGQWSLFSGNPVAFADALDNSTTVSGLTSGSYTLRWTVTYIDSNITCTAHDDMTLLNSSTQNAVASTSDAETCGEDGQLQGTVPNYGSGETGLWTGGAGTTINNPSSCNTTVSNLLLGANTYTWTLYKGVNITCSSSDDVTITNNSVVADAGVDKDAEDCNNFTNLLANDLNLTQGNGSWTEVIPGGTAIIVTPSAFNTAVTDLRQGQTTFRWTVTKGTCPAAVDDVIITNNQVTASVGIDKATCNSSYGPLDGNNPLLQNNPATGLWSSSVSGVTFDNNSIFNTTVHHLQTGSNTLTWTVTSSIANCHDDADIVITNNSITSNAGIDKETCFSDETLQAQIPTKGSGVWSKINGGPVTIDNSANYLTDIHGLTGGQYEFRWTVTYNTCTASDEVIITNNTPQPALASAFPTEVCDGNGTLTGNTPIYADGETGLWTKVDAGSSVIVNAASSVATVSGMKVDDNTFKWTISKGNLVVCKTDATVTITNNELKNISATSGTGTNISCNGNASLVGNNPALQNATGLWTVNTTANILSNTSFLTTASNLDLGPNIFTWTVTKGSCPGVSKDLTITNDMVVANAGADQAVCVSVTSFNAIEPMQGTGTWTIENSPTANISSINEFNSTVSGLQIGSNTFKWTVINNTCSDFDYVNIDNETIVLAPDYIGSICAFEVDLTANPLNGTNTGVWTSASSNPVIANSTSPNTHITNLDYGNNVFFWTVTSDGGCSTMRKFTIVNNSPTPANAGLDKEICTNTTTITANTPLYGTGVWSVATGAGYFANANTMQTVVSNIGPGANNFRWTISTAQCSGVNASSDIVTITNNSFTIDAGVPQQLCVDYTNLNVIDGDNGVWSLVGGSGLIDDSMSKTSAVTNLGAGNNEFRWTVDSGKCVFYDDVRITNNSVAVPAVSGGGEICTNTRDITGEQPTGTETGLWTLVGGAGNIANANSYFTTVTNLSNNTNNVFKWTISDKDCSNSASITIINNSVIANAGSDKTTACSNDVILGASPASLGVGSWSIVSSTGIIQNSLSNTSLVTGLDIGNNFFKWTVVRGICSDDDDVIITNNSVTTADAGSDITTCNTTENLLANEPLYGTGKWTVIGTNATLSNDTQFDTEITLTPGTSSTFTWTISNGVCTSQDDVIVDNQSFTVYAGIDRTLCVNTYTMEGDDPGIGSGLWTTPSGSAVFSNSAQHDAIISDIGLGLNVFRWTITKGACSAHDDVNITNRTVTASASNQNNPPICINSTTLDGNDPDLINSQGMWTLLAPAGANIVDHTLFNTEINNLTPGQNHLRWRVYNEACFKEKDIIVEYYIPTVSAGPDVSACSSTVKLQGNVPPATGSGVWTYLGGGIIDNISVNNANVSDLDIGTNVFTWTIIDRGCSASDDATITNNLPENSAIVDTYEACQSIFTMGAQEPTATGTGLWSVTAGGASFVNESVYNTQVTVDRGTNILTWTITDSGCSASKDFSVTNNLTNPQAGEDASVCINEVGLAAADPGVDNGAWSIVGGATSEIFDNTTFNNAYVTNLRKGTITFKWTVSNAHCSASDFVVVTNNTPTINAGNDRTICEDNIILAANNPALELNTTGLWSNVNHTGTIVTLTKYNTEVTDLVSGANVYKWTVTNPHCSISDEVIITSNRIVVDAGVGVSVCDSIVALNAVTPTIGVWVRVNGTATFDNASIYNTTARNLSPYNKFRWTATSGGCSNYDEVEIYSTLPEIASTEIDKAVCQTTTTITANSPDYANGETGLWTIFGSSGATIVSQTSRNTDITGLDQGPNTFRWTIDNGSGCKTWDDITVTNNQVFADAGTDQRLCLTTANMNAGGAGSNVGTWTIVGTSNAIIANSNLHNTAISNLDPGLNKFKWTVTGVGCSAEDEVILYNDIPTVPNAGADQDVCEANAPLNANNPDVNRGTGIWKLEGGSGSIANVSQFNTTVSGLSSGRNTFSWTITLNACKLRDDVDIYNNSVDVNAGVNQIICSNEYKLAGNDPGASNGKWEVIGGSGVLDNTAQFDTWVRSLAKGTNTLRWTINDGVCENYDEVAIMNNVPIKPTVEADKPVCTDFALIGVNPAPDYANGEAGLWTRTAGNGIVANPTAANTSVSGLAPSVNTFKWTVTKTTSGVSCLLSDEINITNNSIIASTGSNKSVCGTTSTLSGNDPGTGIGEWTRLSGTGIIANSNAYSTTVSNLSTGENIFRWTVTRNLCTDFSDVTITNNQYFSSANPGGLDVLCVDYSEIIADIPPAGTTGKWTMPAGIGTFDDDTDNTTYVRGLGQGTNTIRWTVSKDDCDTPTEFDITNNSVYTSAGSDQIVCLTSTNLNATGAPSGGTGFWTRLSGTGIIANTVSSATSVSNLSLGANTFRWSIEANGCTDDDVVVVSNNTFAVSAGADDISCGTSYTLAADDPTPGTGWWTIEGGNGVFVNPSSSASVVNGLNNGNNSFKWTVTKYGCTFSDIVTITNNLYISDAGDDQLVCSNSAYLGATNPLPGEGSGLWSVVVGSGTFVTATDGASLVTGLGAGENTLRWTVTKTEGLDVCSDYDDVKITNNTVIASAGSNQTTCDNFANLSGSISSTGTGLWTTGGLPTTIIVNPTSAVTLVTGLGGGNNTFTWTVTDKNCTKDFTVQITSNHFQAYAGPDQIVTVNSATLDAQLPDATATGTWSVLNGNGTFVNANTTNTVVNDIAYGVNRYQWTVLWRACTSTDDVRVTYNAIFADAGSDQQICEDFTQLHAVHAIIGTGKWTLIDGAGVFDDPYLENTFVRGIPNGSVNRYRWTVEKDGYSEFDDVLITNNDFVISAGIDKTACVNNAVMTAEAAGVGGTSSWTVVLGSGIFSSNSAENATVTGLSPNANRYEWTVTRNSCTNKDTVEIIYNVPPNADFEMDITEGCSPINVLFTNITTGGDHYEWFYDNKLRYDTIGFTETFEAIYDKDTTFSIQLVAYSPAGCTDTIVHEATVYRIPIVDFLAAPVEQTFPNSTINIENLSNDGYDNYYWTFGDGESIFSINSANPDPHTYGSPGVYEVTLAVAAHGCSDTARQIVTILPAEPKSSADLDRAGCNLPFVASFTANALYADTYYWEFGTLGTSVEENPTFIFTVDGEHTVTLTVTGPGGSKSYTGTVTVYPMPIVAFEVAPDTVMLPNQAIHCYNNSTYGFTYEWNFGDNTDSISNEENPIHYYNEVGEYYINLKVWSEHECLSSLKSEKPVVVEPAGIIKFPNAFSPNISGPSDGRWVADDYTNDIFHPIYRGILEYHLEIYNRWGEKVFISEDPLIGWDGYIDGKLAAQDVYVWKLSGKYKNGVLFKDSGNVTLMR